TWVTLALMNGMPIETVRKVTGHQTANIVTKHYFKPHRKELRKAMQKNMPGLLTTSKLAIDPGEQALQELSAITQKMTKPEILKRVKAAEGLLQQL
ncbi:MAG: integrase, partial [Kiritimatiellales bacterium]